MDYPKQLLEMHPAWLGSLILDSPDNWQFTDLFRTCSKMKHMIFHQPGIRPKLTVNPRKIQWPGLPMFARALAVAEQGEAKVHLDLDVTCANQPALLSQLFTTAAAHFEAAQQPQQLPAFFQLSCITVVTIACRGLHPDLDSFLPDTLVQHCPNLLELTVDDVELGKGAAPQATCTSLQKLTLVVVNGVATEGFKERLLNLPSLTSLEMRGTGRLADFAEGGVFRAAAAKYASQLRVLSVPFTADRGTRFIPWTPTAQLPLLQQLDLEVSLVGDEDVQHLLTTTPNLKRVSMRRITRLTSSFADVPCTWQQPKLDDAFLPEMDKLPLSSCTRLECGSRFFLGDGNWDPATSTEQIVAGVKAMQAVGGLHMSDAASLILFAGDLGSIPAAAPLLQQLTVKTSVSVSKEGYMGLIDAAWSDARALLAALGQHLRCEHVSVFWGGWSGNPGTLAQLPELLPHVQEFGFSERPPVEELVHMARTVARPIVLHGCNKSYYIEKIEEAMQDAGHQFVTFAEAW